MVRLLFCKICKVPRNADFLGSLCKTCLSNHRHKKYLRNKEQISNNSKKYREANKDKIKKRGELYRLKNKEKIKLNRNPITAKNWRKRNPTYKTNRWKIDIQFRLKDNLRGRVYKALKGFTKGKSTMKLVGCSIEDLKIYISTLFKPGMTWDNYGKWHIDHIKPCSLFDFSKQEEQEKCFHYTNLQPLWASENFTKSNKYEQLNISTNI